MVTRTVRSVPESDRRPSELEAIERLRAAIGRLSRRLRPTVAGSELTPSQISVLFTVVRLGPIGLSELAVMESLNATMLSRITAQLCDTGLIVREADPGDRRSAFVAPTAAGRRMRERIHRERARALGAHVKQLDDAQRERLHKCLPVRSLDPVRPCSSGCKGVAPRPSAARAQRPGHQRASEQGARFVSLWAGHSAAGRCRCLPSAGRQCRRSAGATAPVTSPRR